MILNLLTLKLLRPASSYLSGLPAFGLSRIICKEALTFFFSSGCIVLVVSATSSGTLSLCSDCFIFLTTLPVYKNVISLSFSVHTNISIQKNDNPALLNLAQYIIHSSFSPQEINYIEKTHSVIYTSSMHPAKKRNFQILPAIEFLHRICLHIPNPYESLIRYYGFYSSASRGKRNKLSQQKNLNTHIINDAPSPSSCRSSWARLIHLVYEVDPFSYPSCGSPMSIISFITDRQQIIKILQHLDLWPVHYPEKTTDTALLPFLSLVSLITPFSTSPN
jgi:Putative transposase